MEPGRSWTQIAPYRTYSAAHTGLHTTEQRVQTQRAIEHSGA